MDVQATPSCRKFPVHQSKEDDKESYITVSRERGNDLLRPRIDEF
jgi:hypothetical protein